jgi:predicted RecA/RadA family phage recombinase
MKLSVALPLVFGAAFGMAASSAMAQQAASRAKQSVVRVFVVDSAGAAVTGADLAVVRGLNAVIAHGSTDQYGRATLGFASDDGEYDIVVRKIGYPRSDRVFEMGSRDTMALSIVVPPPSAKTLDVVKITAQEDLKTKVYSIDADAIAASTRPLFTSWDIITKLRPDMAGGRAPCNGDRINLWVNGSRIRFVPRNDMAVAREHISRGQAVSGIADIVFALYEIEPEHIAQMRFRDCFDTTVPDVGGSNALFIVLKPGVVYEPGVGSVVADKWPP